MAKLISFCTFVKEWDFLSKKETNLSLKQLAGFFNSEVREPLFYSNYSASLAFYRLDGDEAPLTVLPLLRRTVETQRNEVARCF